MAISEDKALEVMVKEYDELTSEDRSYRRFGASLPLFMITAIAILPKAIEVANGETVAMAILVLISFSIALFSYTQVASTRRRIQLAQIELRINRFAKENGIPSPLLRFFSSDCGKGSLWWSLVALMGLIGTLLISAAIVFPIAVGVKWFDSTLIGTVFCGSMSVIVSSIFIVARAGKVFALAQQRTTQGSEESTAPKTPEEAKDP